MAVNFDPVARPYRWMEYLSFGPFLERCRNTYLSRLTGAQHALILGDGDGRFLKQLLKVNRRLTADVVDSSQTMLQILEKRLGPARERVQLHRVDAMQWQAPRDYDLVVTHFFLDCFFTQQLEELFNRIIPHAKPGTLWVISEFAIPSHAVFAPFGSLLVRLLYRIFKILTGLTVTRLPDHASALQKRGLELVEERRYLAGLLRAQLWLLPLH